MSERKVLNKYYPPDFDPSAIPKMRFSKNRTFNIRIMSPFNMRCNTCGGYIYKGKKFNSRKENVDEEFYLGLRIFRFYIKCPTCVAEIAFKTDLKNTDYTLEAGATRLFEAEKLAKEMAEREIKEKEEEELNNPMKILENRTKASRNEIETIDILGELRELSARQATVNTETMLLQHREYEQQLQKLQDEEEEKEIRSIFGEREDGRILKRLKDDSDSGDDEPKAKKIVFPAKPTDLLSTETFTSETKKPEKKPIASWQKSVGGFSSKSGLKNLVKKKQPNKSCDTTVTTGHSKTETSATDTNSVSVTATKTSLPPPQPTSRGGEVRKSNTYTETNVPTSSSPPSSSVPVTSVPVASSSLGLLGLGYSDSDDSED
ncbi:coiled-coil domain-containing protein 94-like [Mizuhopecten yessoensis]|uniref:Splicing factor YJU2 n=1 Tax=Mizuhopecten yessoensis TaxID=6573 RepID=A0A210R665_MIZYE|nr:coiled-coil domain-containing protein 94-like [Mizuhopecten yessoensis]OWF56406.1 Coiled-coil domain-containing protein 94 [Mizuhopecten yessoensis]